MENGPVCYDGKNCVTDVCNMFRSSQSLVKQHAVNSRSLLTNCPSVELTGSLAVVDQFINIRVHGRFTLMLDQQMSH